MGKRAHEETKASGKPKKSLGTRGTQRQPPPPGEPDKRQLRTEMVVRERKNPEAAQLVAELEKDLKIASAVPPMKRRFLKVRHPQLTPSK